MKLKSRELKALARESLLGHYGLLVAAVLILLVITIGLEGITTSFVTSKQTITSIITQYIVSLIVGILIYLVETGLMVMILKMIRKEPVSLGDLFYVFSHHPDRFIIVGAIQLLIATLLELPTEFMTPATTSIESGNLVLQAAVTTSVYSIVASLISVVILIGFTLCEYLLIDDNDLGAIDSIRESFRLMKGNMWRYIVLEFSFIGICLLTVLTLGIGMLWVIPYMMTAEAFFYLEIIGQLPTNSEETYWDSQTTDATRYARSPYDDNSTWHVDSTPVNNASPSSDKETDSNTSWQATSETESDTSQYSDSETDDDAF